MMYLLNEMFRYQRAYDLSRNSNQEIILLNWIGKCVYYVFKFIYLSQAKRIKHPLPLPTPKYKQRTVVMQLVMMSAMAEIHNSVAYLWFVDPVGFLWPVNCLLMADDMMDRNYQKIVVLSSCLVNFTFGFFYSRSLVAMAIFVVRRGFGSLLYRYFCSSVYSTATEMLLEKKKKREKINLFRLEMNVKALFFCLSFFLSGNSFLVGNYLTCLRFAGRYFY